MKRSLKFILMILMFISVFTLFGCVQSTQIYQVVLETEEGEVIDVITVQNGKKIEKPLDPVKEGYTFLGWYYGEEIWSFIGYVVTENMKLTAKYQINQYTIYFNTNGGNYIDSITLDYNSPIILPNDPVRPGYQFLQWDVEIPTNMPGYNIIANAIWEKSENSIMIGSSGPLSGSVSIFGQVVKRGIELAIEEINKAGGVNVNGKMHQLELLDFYNDEADPNKAGAALTSLVEKGADIIVGAVTSGATEGLITEAVKHGVPVITPTGTADKLTIGDSGDERDIRYNIFRACFYDSYQGKFMAEYASSQGIKKAFVLYNNSDDYSKSLKDAFVETAKSKGIQVDTVAYSNYDRDFNPFWARILSGGYDCVYVPDYYENVYNILKTGYAKGYTGVCYGGDGWDGVIKQVKEGEDTSYLEKSLNIPLVNASMTLSNSIEPACSIACFAI